MKTEDKKITTKDWISQNMSNLTILIHKVHHYLYLVMIIWISLCIYPQTKTLIYPHYGFSYVLIISGWTAIATILFSAFRWKTWKKGIFWMYLLSYIMCVLNLIYLYEGPRAQESTNILLLLIIIALLYLKLPISMHDKNK
jgi:hypothetical protein